MSRRRPFFAADPTGRPLQDPDPTGRPLQDPDPTGRPLQDPDPTGRPLQDPDPTGRPLQDPDPTGRPLQDPDPTGRPLQDPDPDVVYALQLLQDRLRHSRPGSCRCGCICRCGGTCRCTCRCGCTCPCTCRRPDGAKLDYSGFIIVRLAPHLDLSLADSATNLAQAARKLKLRGLARVLRRHRLRRSSSRLVALDDNDYVREHAMDDVTCGNYDVPNVRGRNDLDRLEKAAANSDLPPLRSLASYWRVNVHGKIGRTWPRDGEKRLDGWEPGHEDTVDKILRQLNELPEVDLAYRELAVSDPAPPPDPAGRGDAYGELQEYRHRAPVGIDARWAYRQGGDGSGVGVVDLEQGWILTHQELAEHTPIDLIAGLNRDDTEDYSGDHGTAVLAQLAAGVEETDDGDPVPVTTGVVGIAPRVSSLRVTSHYDGDDQTPPNVANAIRQAIRVMNAGDVLLLEVQRSLLPSEADDADFHAIRLATAHGIIVVEAAGNGEEDLDRFFEEAECEVSRIRKRVLNRRSRYFRESGAIMVGSAWADLPHNRLSAPPGSGSNYGSRVDCFGYGQGVVTAGYGMHPGVYDEDRVFTRGFGGTSGASPIVAGAALVIQGMHLQHTEGRLSPWEMRALLSDPATGTRQGRGVPGHIGVMPDLKAILKHRLQLVPDLYLRDHIADTGAVPTGRRIGACPDIIVVDRREPDPDDRFGEKSASSYIGGHECTVGFDHHIYLRLRNRGSQSARVPRATLYWSEVATLVTPDTWKKLTPRSVRLLPPNKVAPPDDTLVVGYPIIWRRRGIEAALQARVGESRHLCFIAIVEDPGDDELVLPPFDPPYFDWHVFRAFLREHNGVAVRNVHRVVESRAADGSVVLPFLWSGAPDRARTFDFQIVQRLPERARVHLEVPAPLVAPLRRRRLWTSDPDPGDLRFRLDLPKRARWGFSRVRLVAQARHPCRFRITGGGLGRGHSLAIRQIYRGEEVGQITWLFGRCDEECRRTREERGEEGGA